MEVYHAKYDYVKQRKDVMSFKKGEQFYVIDKPNDEWWKARKLDDNAFGYVPSIYLEKSQGNTIGRLVPEGRRNTREHDIHLQALAELHQRVKPLPAHVIGHALGVDVPKESVSRAPQVSSVSSKQQQKFSKTDFRLTSPEQAETPSSSHSNYTGSSHAPRARSPSPKPLPKIKPRNGSFRREEDFLPPYHHKSPPPSVSSPPPPDYDVDEDEEDTSNEVPYHHRLNSSGRYIDLTSIEDPGMEEGPPTMAPTAPPNLPSGRVDEEGFIVPKPLGNPVKESPVHRDLHRELRHSGRKVLNTESELTKKFRDRSQRQTKKAMEEDVNSRRTSFDIKLEERLKLQEQESRKNLEVLEKAAREPEFMKIQLKSRSGSRKT